MFTVHEGCLVITAFILKYTFLYAKFGTYLHWSKFGINLETTLIDILFYTDMEVIFCIDPIETLMFSFTNYIKECRHILILIQDNVIDMY